MAEESDESPLDLATVLRVLESDTASDEQVLDAYTKLSHHIDKELSLFERDFVQQGRHLVAVTKKHVTSDGELKHSVTPKALSVMAYCVSTTDIVSQLSAVEMGELVSLWGKIITETKEKFTCVYAFTCINSQRFPASIMIPELPSLMNAFCRTAVSWWDTSTKVEQAAMYSIQRLGEQCPKEMKGLCSKWGPPYLRLLVSQFAPIREHAYSRIQKWSVFLASSQEFLSAGVSTVTKQIVPVLNTMFTSGSEGFALKTCTLLMQVFKQELQNISLINSLLTIQEQAFRCSSSDIRFQAFKSWEVLIDIFSNKGIHKKQKFVELIMRVFKTRNASTERVAVAKLNSWWRYVLLMGPAVWTQFEQILRSLLQFCLGNAKLGIDSGSSLSRAIHDPYGDAVAQVTSSVPGSPVVLPAFPQLQQGGLAILTYLLQDADHPATWSLDLKPLESDNTMPLSVCIKNAHFLISAMVEVSKLFAATHESQVIFVWERMTSFILIAVERDRDDSNAAVSSFLSQFQALASANVLQSKLVMKLFKLVCSLPADVLSAPSLLDGSLFKCRSHSLCELLLSSSVLTDFGEQESFVTLFMTLVKCGTKHPGSTLPFLETVGKLLDSRASSMASAQVLWRLWSYMAHVLNDYISTTNQVDQDDGLWPNFGCLYTVLLLPVTYMLSPKVPQPVQKKAMGTLTDLYLTFARLAAMVTTAEDNIVIEEFSHKILNKVSADSYGKDIQTLEHLVELCQTVVGTVDFSSLTSANPFMKGIRSTPSTKPRSSPKPLGNLHSCVSLLTRLVDWVVADIQQELDKSSGDKQKSSENWAQLGSCCSKVMDILTTLVTSVHVSSLVSHLLDTLASPVAAVFAAVPKKLPAKICTTAFTHKLDRLWQEVCGMLRSDYKGQYDSDLLHQLAPLLQAAFLHSRRSIKNQTVQLWNATFGASSAPLTYPADLQGVLVKMREKTQLSLPGWTAVDVAIIDETPVSQMSQMDSQAPEPMLPGMPSPVRLRGSFLNRDVSPKPTPKSASPKRIQLTSENKRSASSVRKRLPLESLPQKDFVVITGTPKRRHVLTEHQKEVLKEKRALPAMYNNLEASQDLSLMAHFSSDNTQQDSILDKPAIDDVIVVNSSQSQVLPEPEPVSTDQPPKKKPEDPIPRRSSRRSSVRFQESKEGSQSSDLPAKKTSEERPEVVSTSEQFSQETTEKHGDAEAASKVTAKQQSEVISLLEGSSQDTDQNSEKSLRFLTPQPNQMADAAEKLIESSSSKDTSQSEIPQSSGSSNEKRGTRSALRMRMAGRRSLSSCVEQTSSRQSTTMSKSSSKRRTLSQEPKTPPQVQEKEQQKPRDPYTVFKNWLNKDSAEEQTREKQSRVSEKRNGKGDKTSSEAAAVLEKQPKSVHILAEETRSSVHSVIETTSGVISVEESPTETSASKVIPETGTKRRSTRRYSIFAEQPVANLSKGREDSQHSSSLASSKEEEDTPKQRSRFKPPPPVVCDEVASQGYPGDTDSAQSSPVEPLGQRRSKRKRKQSVDESTDHSQLEMSSLLDKHSEIGFSGLLKQSLDQGSESCVKGKNESVEESEKSVPVSKSPVRQTYDPLLSPTLRLTPLSHHTYHFLTPNTLDDAVDSQKLSVGADSNGNESLLSQNDNLADSPATFDPTKDSTLSEQTERSRKRKQQTPKKIPDPSVLRRTPRKHRHKAGCSCCKMKPGSKPQDSPGQAEKLNSKQGQGEFQSPQPGTSKPVQEKFGQNSPHSSENKSSKKKVRKENAADNLETEEVRLSPQEVCEVTPKSKTSCTPLRQSTTERKKKVAREKSSKSLTPTLDRLFELDAESSRLASQSPAKPKKCKKDVFDSKKNKKTDTDMKIYTCEERMEVSPTTMTLNERPVKTLIDDGSRQKRKRKGLKFNSVMRSPPRLRLRRKKIAPSDEPQSDGNILDTQAEQKMDQTSSIESIAQSESVKELSRKPAKGDRRKMTQQKKKSPTFLAQSRFSHSTHNLVKNRRTWIKTYPRRGIRKRGADKETGLQDMSMESGSETASKEALIEHYESDQNSSDITSQAKPQGSHQALKSEKGSSSQNLSLADNSEKTEESRISESESKPRKRQSSDRKSKSKTPEDPEDGKTENKPDESQSQEDTSKNKPQENGSEDGENVPQAGGEGDSTPEEMGSAEGENNKKTMSDGSGSQGFEPPVSENETSLAEKSTAMVVSGVQEEKTVTCGSSLNTSEQSEATMNIDQSEDIFGDSCAEVTSKQSTSAIHIAHCGSSGYTAGEGSADMFGEDGPGSPPLSSPFSQPFHSDSYGSMNDDSDSDAMASAFSEEVLDSDFPHNQRGLEMEQDSPTASSEVNELIVETAEEHERLDTDQDAKQKMAQSAHRTINQEESSCHTAIDQAQKTSSEETIQEVPVPPGQKLSKTELFMLIDQSDASTQEIIDYLRSRERRKQSSYAVPEPKEDSGNSEGRELDSSSLGPESPGHGNSSDSRNTDASLLGVNAMNCDEVDCLISVADSSTEGDVIHSGRRSSLSVAEGTVSCVASKSASTYSESSSGAYSKCSSAVSSEGTSGVTIPQASENAYSNTGEGHTDSLGTTRNSHACVPLSEFQTEFVSAAFPSESSTSSASASAGSCSSSAVATDSRSESSGTPEKQGGAGITLSQLQSAFSTCSSHSVDDDLVQKEIPQDMAEASTSSASGISLTPASGVPGSSIQPSQTPSPSILKRPHNGSFDSDTPSSKKKPRRLQVSFANPVEVGGTPTCDECRGVPTCDQCRRPDTEENRRNFKEQLTRMRERSKQRKASSKRRKCLEGTVTLMGKQKFITISSPSNSSDAQSPSTSTDEQSASSSKDTQNAGSSKDTQSPGTSRGTLSQLLSETQSTNSYHSTLESQMDSVNAVFPDLVDCKDPFDSILPSLTASLFCRGLHSMLLGRGISTVGQLASLTERQVEKLPFCAPKTKTLRNALRNYQSKYMPQKSTGKPEASGLQCNEGAAKEELESSS